MRSHLNPMTSAPSLLTFDPDARDSSKVRARPAARRAATWIPQRKAPRSPTLERALLDCPQQSHRARALEKNKTTTRAEDLLSWGETLLHAGEASSAMYFLSTVAARRDVYANPRFSRCYARALMAHIARMDSAFSASANELSAPTITSCALAVSGAYEERVRCCISALDALLQSVRLIEDAATRKQTVRTLDTNDVDEARDCIAADMGQLLLELFAFLKSTSTQSEQAIVNLPGRARGSDARGEEGFNGLSPQEASFWKSGVLRDAIAFVRDRLKNSVPRPSIGN